MGTSSHILSPVTTHYFIQAELEKYASLLFVLFNYFRLIMKTSLFQIILLSVFLLIHNVSCQYETTEGSGEEGSGSGSGEEGSTTTEGTTTEEETTTTTTPATTTIITTTTIKTTTQKETTLQQVSCCTPQQLGEIILLIIQLLIIEGIIEGPGLGGSTTTTTPLSLSTAPNIPMVPGAAVIPGGPLEVDSNRDSMPQISGATALPSLQSNMENIYPPIIDLDRKGKARIFFDYDHFSLNTNRLFRSSKSQFHILKNNQNNLKIKIRRKKGKEIKYKIEIKESSNLFRGPQKKIKFTFTADEMNELSRDRLLRTVNYKKKLYRCKIFKRCKKIVCTSKNKQLCEKIKRKRRQKRKKEKTVTIASTPKSLFRGS